jgi:uncharacterized protein (DUF736 family)
MPQRVRATFFRWAPPIPRENRESPPPPILRSAAARNGCGVDRLRLFERHRGRDGRASNTAIKQNHHCDHRRLQEVRRGVLGQIVTLNVQTKNVRIAPEANRTSENAPSHRIFVGRAAVGAALSKRPRGSSTISRSSWTTRVQRPDLRGPRPGRGRRKRCPHLVPQPQGQRRLRPFDDAPTGSTGGEHR